MCIVCTAMTSTGFEMMIDDIVWMSLMILRNSTFHVVIFTIDNTVHDLEFYKETVYSFITCSLKLKMSSSNRITMGC